MTSPSFKTRSAIRCSFVGCEYICVYVYGVAMDVSTLTSSVSDSVVAPTVLQSARMYQGVRVYTSKLLPMNKTTCKSTETPERPI